MKGYKIEKGIPIINGVPRGCNAKLPAYPLREIEVGDSFILPRTRQNAVVAAAGLIKDKKFITRKVDDETIRVWRIE